MTAPGLARTPGPPAHQDAQDLVAAALAAHDGEPEHGPQPLCPNDPDCPCERGPFDFSERGHYRIPVRLDMACPAHGLNLTIPVPVEIRRVPPKENA